MSEYHAVRYLWLVLQVRRDAARRDERGVSTLEAVLLTAGFAVLAIGALLAITAKVNSATNSIPTGPTGSTIP